MTWVAHATAEVNAKSQYVTIIAVCIVISVLSVSIVSARLWVRYSGPGLAADDYMAALSMVFAVIYAVMCIVQTKFGLGLPIALRPKPDLIAYTRVNYAGRPFYQMGISFFKIALLISYLRLFRGTSHRLYRTATWCLMGIVFLGHLGCTLALIFACSPVDKSWNPTKKGTCLPTGPSFTGYAAVTIASDCLVTLLPLPVLATLNIQKSKKIGLVGIFVLGIFTTICSIMRYLQIHQIQYGDGNSTMLVLWGVIEHSVGNMVSSLPFLAPVFIRRAKQYRSKQSNGYSSGDRPRRLAGRGSEVYKLGSMGRDNAFDGVKAQDSDENILVQRPGASIMKSVTYSVRVEDESESVEATPHHGPTSGL